MSQGENTVLLRLEGPLQAWGDTSKFVIRRTMEAPTKSGVLGLVCCAMGLSRGEAAARLPSLNTLAMGVRIDRPGTRWWDYQTVGARTGMTTAAGGLRTGAQGTLVTRREYLCDASFLVALQAEPCLVAEVAQALQAPRWPLFLGRKCCPPAAPIFETTAHCADLRAALSHLPWRPRTDDDIRAGDDGLPCLLEWRPSEAEPAAPPDAEVWYDRPVFFDPPVHEARLIVRDYVKVDVGKQQQTHTPPPPRLRANYQNSEYRKARAARLAADHELCVFCKARATTVQHVTYRRAGGNEVPEDLRSLCRLCHDAVTMIEYGLGMGLDRINPEDRRWRKQIIQKRDEIRKWRSLEGRKRALWSAAPPVKQELLEEDEG